MRKDYNSIIMEAANNVAGEKYDSLEEAQVALLQEMNRISDDDDDFVSTGIVLPESPLPPQDPIQIPNSSDFSGLFSRMFSDLGGSDFDRFMDLFEDGCKEAGIKPKNGTYTASGKDLRSVAGYINDHWDDDEDDED